jgi:SAM-dependent methyltransferase
MPFTGEQLNREKPGQRNDESSTNYMLATGEAALSRLEMLEKIFGPHSRELLGRAGLAKGMRVADIGCGAGLVSLWIASQIGASGSVVGVDASSEQLRIAGKNAAGAGLSNASFQEGTAYETNLPRGQFGLVYSRFLMCHVSEPAKAIREMSGLLKPDGILVCEDHDDGGIFSQPPTRAYKRLVEISEAVNRARGLDSYVGLKLPRLVGEAGFARPEVMVKQIAELRGPNKRFWEVTLREATPAILAAGAATEEELDTICTELRAVAEDETILVMLARVTQVWARLGSRALMTETFSVNERDP